MTPLGSHRPARVYRLAPRSPRFYIYGIGRVGEKRVLTMLERVLNGMAFRTAVYVRVLGVVATIIPEVVFEHDRGFKRPPIRAQAP